MIEILSTGLLNSVQDLGRSGRLSSGVSMGGAMDRQALETANLLLGNDYSAAGLEITMFSFRMRSEEKVVVAVTGADCEVRIGGCVCPPWWASTIEAGEVLTLDIPRSGARAYIAFEGGIDVPRVLGSRATDLRGRFGGHNGMGLSRGDRLALLAPKANAGRQPAGGLGAIPPERVGVDPTAPVRLRVLPAAEYEGFTAGAHEAFAQLDWTVTPDANRMGYRLSGAPLTLRTPLELFSHGIVPGTVQVPPSGQPIIQLADANTCGGYPKIATVIEADLWRLAQAPVGALLRFEIVSHVEAVDAIRAQAQWKADFIEMRALLTGA